VAGAMIAGGGELTIDRIGEMAAWRRGLHRIGASCLQYGK